MSKKSHPGDGQYGKGTKGMKRPFEDVFAPHEVEAKVEQPQQAVNAEDDQPADEE